MSYRAAFVDDNPHPFNLVHLNGDNMPAFAAARGRRYFRRSLHHRLLVLGAVGLPRRMGAVLRLRGRSVDGDASSCRTPFAAWSPVPVVRMPLPIVLPPLPPLGRAHFGAPEGRARSSSTSSTCRARWSGRIRWRRHPRLPPRRAAAADAVLVLKFTNPEYDRAGVRRLHEEAAGLNVVMLDGYFDRPELCALINGRRLLSLAAPFRRIRVDDARIDAARQAGDRHRIFRQHGLHDRGNSYLLDYSLVTLTRDYGPYLRGVGVGGAGRRPCGNAHPRSDSEPGGCG